MSKAASFIETATRLTVCCIFIIAAAFGLQACEKSDTSDISDQIKTVQQSVENQCAEKKICSRYILTSPETGSKIIAKSSKEIAEDRWGKFFTRDRIIQAWSIYLSVFAIGAFIARLTLDEYDPPVLTPISIGSICIFCFIFIQYIIFDDPNLVKPDGNIYFVSAIFICIAFFAKPALLIIVTVPILGPLLYMACFWVFWGYTSAQDIRAHEVDDFLFIATSNVPNILPPLNNELIVVVGTTRVNISNTDEHWKASYADHAQVFSELKRHRREYFLNLSEAAAKLKISQQLNIAGNRYQTREAKEAAFAFSAGIARYVNSVKNIMVYEHLKCNELEAYTDILAKNMVEVAVAQVNQKELQDLSGVIGDTKPKISTMEPQRIPIQVTVQSALEEKLIADRNSANAEIEKLAKAIGRFQ